MSEKASSNLNCWGSQLQETAPGLPTIELDSLCCPVPKRAGSQVKVISMRRHGQLSFFGVVKLCESSKSYIIGYWVFRGLICIWVSMPNPHWNRAHKMNANPLMLLVCSVDTPIHAHRFHLLALRCALRGTSCVDEAPEFRTLGYSKVRLCTESYSPLCCRSSRTRCTCGV